MMDVHSWEPDDRLVMDWAEHNAHAGDGEEARAEAEAELCTFRGLISKRPCGLPNGHTEPHDVWPGHVEANATEAPYVVVSQYVSDTGGQPVCSVHDGSLRIPHADTGRCHVFAEYEVTPRLDSSREDEPSSRLACSAHLATVCEHLLGEPV